MDDANIQAWDGWLEPIMALERKVSRKSAAAPGAEQREVTRVEQKLRRLRTALDRLGVAFPNLYRGEVDLDLSAEQVEQLIAEICGDEGGYELRDIQRYLVSGLAKGIGDLGWQMPLPPPMVICGVESSNMNPDTFRRLAEFDQLNAAFFGDLESTDTDTEPDILDDSGQLLLSLCLHSGVCKKTWLTALPAAIIDGCGVHERTVWLELGTDGNLDKTDYTERRRRLFLAPVTQLLLRRWCGRWGRRWPHEETTGKRRPVDFLMKRFAKKLCRDSDLPSHIADRCLRLSESNLVTQLPNSLVHYLSSLRVGVPLPEQNWLRLLTDRRGYSDMDADEATPLRSPEGRQIATGHQYPDQQVYFGDLRRAVGTLNSSEFSEFVVEFLGRSEVSPVLQLMAQWAEYLRERGGVVKRKLAKNSVVRYLNWIKPMVFYADELNDPINLDEDSWQAIYDEIIANAHGMISDCAGRLSAFHQFLVDAHGVPPVDIAGMSADRQVDARLLTPREYRRVRALIRNRAVDETMADSQELILIFGYRLGLRRGEAYSRLFSDFPGLDIPELESAELLVRPNKNARIKSDTSTRRLPLNVLLMDDELRKLEQFYQRRRDLVPGNPRGKALFGDVVGTHWPAIIARLFDPVTRALKEVTGDSRFRFHHLRHSFVTLTFLRLIEGSPCEFIPSAWREGERGDPLLPHTDTVFGRLARLSDTGQALWQLAMWAGHASPQVTMECYLHLLDWSVGRFLNKRHNPELSIRAQQVLLDKRPAALEKFRSRKALSRAPTPAHEIAEVVSDKWPETGLRESPRLERHVALQEKVALPAQRVRWLDPYKLQFLAAGTETVAGARRIRGLESAAQMLGIALHDAERWDRRAKHIMSWETNRMTLQRKASPPGLPMITSRTRMSRRTPAVLRSLDRKDLSRGLPEVPGRFIAPPHTKDAKSYSELYFNRLMAWFEGDPDYALTCMRSVLACSQRSKAEIRPRDPNGNQCLYELLRKLELASRTTITVKLRSDGRIQSEKESWADFFAVPSQQIEFALVVIPKNQGVNGRCRISVDPPPALNRKQNLFWSVLRFAVFSAYVACAYDVEGELGKG
ncbi:site-specific integrase [Marinobacter lipolyticus]|uniref:hypothetical protein n=1 Tax=Marinobacter lipolyticus TaxID=209639 RepID=UPI001BCC4FE3|nr:hypothetical protein [Marinobacter lipolyticus]MBS8241670.1 site-specific integrase [Marinobacter lipolyticus]